MTFPHQPVLIAEFLKQFEGVKIFTFFEGTVGAGGHAEAILKAHPEITRYIGSDVDPDALCLARERLMPWKDKVELIQGNFSQLGSYLEERKVTQVDGFFLT